MIKQTGTLGRIPLSSELAYGDLILNYRDGKLYYKGYDNIIRSFSVEAGDSASFSWDFSRPSPNAIDYTGNKVTDIHRNMRRCLVLDNGTVNYYLNAFNSLLKEDGTASVLTGADGQVMVEIPQFYYKKITIGTISTWSIANVSLPGYVIHPAFIKDGVQVPYRYIGAYDACVYDTSAAAYISGLNLDNADGILDYTADKLSSVSGAYPIVGITRAQGRTLAGLRGSGWRQLDFWLVNAIQLLYLIEYQSFYSQNLLGPGNTTDVYVTSSSVQEDSPHSIAGCSNSLGNASTTLLSGKSAVTNPPTAFMSYRGIENFYGNSWAAVDGINLNNYIVYTNNTTSQFTDDTATNYINIGTAGATSGYPIKFINKAFIPLSVGGSSTTYITDYYYTASGWCVVFFGGAADVGAAAGAFYWYCGNASSTRTRRIGSRLAR